MAARCDVGQVRKMNQDTIFSSTDPVGLLPNLYVVADGMGGHRAGDLASAEAVRYFVKYIEENSAKADDIEQLLKEALTQANRHVYELALSSEDYEGMGTTFLAATICGDSLHVINVGDSRMYVLNHAGERPMSLQRITEDHSIVEMMVRQGVLTEEEARVHPQKNMITRAVGTEKEVEIDTFCVDIKELIRVLLCSDGLTNMVTDLEILSALSDATDVEETADKLVNIANDNGGKDNISVIVIDLTGEEIEHA